MNHDPLCPTVNATVLLGGIFHDNSDDECLFCGLINRVREDQLVRIVDRMTPYLQRCEISINAMRGGVMGMPPAPPPPSLPPTVGVPQKGWWIR